VSAAITDSNPPGQFYCPTCEKNFDAGERCPTDGTRLVRIHVPVDPLLGRELDGRYLVVHKIGQGGMGAVYRGTQLGLGREVAIKVVSAHLVTEPDVVKRFLREAKLASRLTHPNAVAVLDFNQTADGLFYLVMELVSGRTLDLVFEAEHALRAERIIRIGTQVCDALEGAHALQIVHRDLKPSNIMILDRGRDLVKVLDFGLAKSVAPDQTTTTMTNAGALLGTPAFMPPELALGERCDGRADLYSLGVVLYLLGSGRLPFVSDSAHELIRMHATEDAPPMTGVPSALASVIDKMLRKAPNDRYQSAAENREALETALDALRTSTPAAGVPVMNAPSIAAGVRVPSQVTLVPHETLVPPSLVESRKRAQSASAMHAIATSETIAPSGVARAVSTPLGTAPIRRRWVIPAIVTVVVIAGGAALLAMNRGGAKQPAGGTGSASAAGSAAMGSAVTAGSDAGEIEMTRVPPPPPVVEVGSASTSTSTQTGSPTPTPTPKHHHDKPVLPHDDKTVPHGEKTVPHTVDKTVKPQGPKPPDPGTSNGSALPF